MSEPGSSPVVFRDANAFRRRREFTAFAGRLRSGLARRRQFLCLVANDAELRRLNKRFLGHDYATDVLSFPSGAPSGPLGEIAISLDRAKAQAKELGHSTFDELCILALHGVLHLTGMDHETDKGEMRRKEIVWRRKLGLPPGLIERVSA